MFEDPLQQGIEAVRGYGLVHLSPVDLGVGYLIVYRELVFGTAAGARDRVCHQGSIGRQPAFAAHQCALDQLRNWRVYKHLRSSGQCLHRLRY